MQPDATTERGAPARVAGANRFRRILVPVDLSEGAAVALGLAMDFRARFGSIVDVLHLTPPGALGSADANGAEDLVTEATGTLCRFVEAATGGQEAQVNVHVVVGADVVQSVVSLAQRIDATMVILPSRHRRAVFRTRAERIAQQFSGTVMVVPRRPAS